MHDSIQMVNTEIRLIIFFAAKDREALYSQQRTRPGADCGSDHQLPISKFRLKLKKVGKTTRPFRYDINQIPYDYKVEITNRFNGLDLEDRVSEELWTEVYNTVQEAVTKTISKGKKNTGRENGFLRRPYKLPRIEENQKAKEKRKEILN